MSTDILCNSKDLLIMSFIFYITIKEIQIQFSIKLTIYILRQDPFNAGSLIDGLVYDFILLHKFTSDIYRTDLLL